MLWEIDCANVISFDDLWDVSAVLRRCSLTPARLHHASLQITSATSAVLLLLKQPVEWTASAYRDRCCRFYSTTCPDSCTSYVEIPVAVVGSIIRFADFRQVAPLCVIDVINMELADVFRIQHCSSVPETIFTRQQLPDVRWLFALSVGHFADKIFGSRPSDHYFSSVCWFVCLFVCLFVCAEFFSAVFDPISIKLGHMLYVWV